MKEIKIVSLFSGIGAFEESLKNLKIPFKVENWCEVDIVASKAYSLIHKIPEELNLGDITKVDTTTLPDFDLLTYGFPCQSFSIQGKRLGFEDTKKGNLFFESMRIVKDKRPKYLLAENVKGLVTHNKGGTLKTVLDELSSLGYNNYYDVLNSINFGVPQSRERLYILSIRDDIDTRDFKMPKGVKTNKTLLDIIEDSPSRKEVKSSLAPYLSSEYFLKKYSSEFNIQKLFDGYREGYFKSGFSDNRIYSIKGVSPTLITKNNTVFYEIGGYLTSRERFALQGFAKEYADLLTKKGISTYALNRLIGNSISVSVLESIFKRLFLK